mmetsp:Transcript_9629/g.19563  ORF Transcript_9629/g.19563 Transcript_9629/m.19563 type:complete len:227 (+) Transcript_9629:947-1627(+)
MDTSPSTSRCPRFTTPTYPIARGTDRLLSMSDASVPGSIRSSFVSTPMVRSPSGSTARASFTASLFARSVLAADTARMMTFGLEMYERHMFLSMSSISSGWSPEATRVIPGRSTSVRSSTRGLYIFNTMGSGDTPFPFPTVRRVSTSISLRMSRNEPKRCSPRWRKVPYSSPGEGVSSPSAREPTGAALLLDSCSTSGRLVQIPAPRGRKLSMPTMASNTLLLPED